MDKDNGVAPSSLEGLSAAATPRSEVKGDYCPRCDVLVSASDIAAGVVCRSRSKAFSGSPCYFDDRAWGNPPGTAAQKLRSRLQPAAAVEAPISAEDVNNNPPPAEVEELVADLKIAAADRDNSYPSLTLRAASALTSLSQERDEWKRTAEVRASRAREAETPLATISRAAWSFSEAAMSEDDLKECDCCGEMKPDVRASFIPHAGDTSACAECRGYGAPQDLRAQAIEECAKWHDGQFEKYAKLAKEAADRQDMTSNGFHADTAQHHMMSAAALRVRVLHGGIDNESNRPETGEHLPGNAGLSLAAMPDLQAGRLSERDRELRPHGVGASPCGPSEPRDPSSGQAAVAEDE
jgi:hypothetical protein